MEIFMNIFKLQTRSSIASNDISVTKPVVTFKNIESYFWWKGDINQSKEVQLMIKCKKENLNNVCNKIAEWHSYELPEIIYFRVETNKNYYQWVNSI